MQQDAQGPYVPGPQPQPRHRRPYRSPFWAVVLIAAGVLWLLFNSDVLSSANARMLALLWPILVVGLGVDLLVGRRSMIVGGLVGVVTVALVVVFMLLGPSLGWTGSETLVTETHNIPVGQAASASITIDSGRYGANLHALPASSAADRTLLGATISYTGTLHLETVGETEKVVTLATQRDGWWLPWIEGINAKPWDIGLDATLPLALDYQTSSGSVVLDLSSLQLTGLKVGVSSGNATVTLPTGTGKAYAADLHLSSGDLKAQASAGSLLDMGIDISSGDAVLDLGADSDGSVDFHGSSGGFTLQLAAGQACRVEVRQVSSGDVHLPDGFARTSEGKGKEGTWETANYASAAHKLLVTVSISSGDVRIRLGN
jgi:hypothetical protein